MEENFRENNSVQENKSVVMSNIKEAMTSKYAIVAVGITAISGLGYLAWKKFRCKKAAEQPAEQPVEKTA